jgi:spore coat polysaccharide biosynthesis protein SpsF (cytidylyltransferase family)
MKIGIIIQARTDSKRFPNKVLELINSKSVLWHVINRCKKTPYLVIVSTTNRIIDDSVIDIAKTSDVNYFRGSTDDVLDRFYQTAKHFSLDLIIRITADCPLIDPVELVNVVEPIQNNGYDYAGLDEKTYPDGLDSEAFTFTALEKTWKNSKLKSEREHVTPYIKNPANGFKISYIVFKKNCSNIRLSIDHLQDLDLIRNIFNELQEKENFYFDDILQILNRKPELLKINQQFKRNEGYQKSIQDDKPI